MINQENWTFCRYELGQSRAFIFAGGEPDDSGEFCELFYETILDADGACLFQRVFKHLNEALASINQRSSWSFVDGQDELEAKKSAGGCSTCQAH